MPPDSDSKTVCDQIHLLLQLNQLQRLIVEGILDHVIKNKGRMYLDSDQQLLIYVRGEGAVGKSRVVKAIEMGFTLLGRRKELVISAPTGSAANVIGRSTVHTALGVNNRAGKNYQVKINSQWLYRSSLIIDEVSMIDLKLLTSMDKQLRKAKGTNSHSTTVFGGLPLVVLMGDFYQFAPVLGRALWDHPVGQEEVHGKSLWSRFTSILTLTEQMRQKTDLPFQEMLRRAGEGKLDSRDVNALNRRLAMELPTSGALDTVIVVQKNKTRHLINRLQIEKFARANNRDIIIFPAEHYRTKKDGGNLIQHESLFEAQDGEGNCTGPGLLLYCRGMPACLLANQFTPLGIVNGARAIVHGVVPHLNSKNISSGIVRTNGKLVHLRGLIL